MYTTEYDLMVAASRARELRQQMQMIRAAEAVKAVQGAHADHPSLLGRLVSFASHSLHIGAGNHKVGAAA